MYISRYTNEGIAVNEVRPFYDNAVESSVDLLDYESLALYHDVGGSIIVWRSIAPKTFVRLDKALRRDNQ